MLAQFMQSAVALCLVCSSVKSQSVFMKMAERTEIIFGREASFSLSYIVLERNSDISENKGRHFFMELCPIVWN